MTRPVRSRLGWPAWSRSERFQDAALAVLLAAAAAVPGNGALGVELGDLPNRTPDALAVLLLAAQTLPLAVRRRKPAVTLAVVALGFAAHQFLGYAPTVAGLGLYVALYSAGAHLAGRRRLAAVLALGGYLALAIALHANGSPATPGQLVTFAPVLVLFWVAGSWVRRRREGQAALRASEAAAAVSQERARIARELHDVVSHHVTAMVVQAEATQFLVEQNPAKAAAALEVIGETGRSAMTDLRDLLGVLHGVDDRTPAVGSLVELVERTRTAGLTVELHELGSRADLTAGVELGVHRVVQEALTNAVKHAPGCSVDVRVARSTNRVEVEVLSTSAGTARRGFARSGRGLAGLEERVGFVGGRFEAGRTADGGFAVRASIPVGGSRGA